MKTKKIFLVLSILVTLLLVGCGNKNIFIGNQTYHYATIDFGGEIKRVEIVSWKDFDDGDQIEIALKDGINMLLHSNRVILSNK